MKKNNATKYGKPPISAEAVLAKINGNGAKTLLKRGEVVALLAKYMPNDDGKATRDFRRMLGNQFDLASKPQKARTVPRLSVVRKGFCRAESAVRWIRSMVGGDLPGLPKYSRVVELAADLHVSVARAATLHRFKPDSLELCHELLDKLYDHIVRLEPPAKG
ncbi:MAG: hypothetical protein KDI71_22610 [Xanthomonadales bacterium]|nr:hypothetical protein [Xanthomonadales bacterium]